MGFNPRGQLSTAAIVTYSSITFYVQYLAAKLVGGVPLNIIEPLKIRIVGGICGWF
jgi:hypothetical protein